MQESAPAAAPSDQRSQPVGAPPSSQQPAPQPAPAPAPAPHRQQQAHAVPIAAAPLRTPSPGPLPSGPPSAPLPSASERAAPAGPPSSRRDTASPGPFSAQAAAGQQLARPLSAGPAAQPQQPPAQQQQQATPPRWSAIAAQGPANGPVKPLSGSSSGRPPSDQSAKRSPTHAEASVRPQPQVRRSVFACSIRAPFFHIAMSLPHVTWRHGAASRTRRRPARAACCQRLFGVSIPKIRLYPLKLCFWHAAAAAADGRLRAASTGGPPFQPRVLGRARPRRQRSVLVLHRAAALRR